jgi:hypothetical protein
MTHDLIGLHPCFGAESQQRVLVRADIWCAMASVLQLCDPAMMGAGRLLAGVTPLIEDGQLDRGRLRPFVQGPGRAGRPRIFSPCKIILECGGGRKALLSLTAPKFTSAASDGCVFETAVDPAQYKWSGTRHEVLVTSPIRTGDKSFRLEAGSAERRQGKDRRPWTPAEKDAFGRQPDPESFGIGIRCQQGRWHRLGGLPRSRNKLGAGSSGPKELGVHSSSFDTE